MSDNTLYARPLPKRPPTGLLAWQATMGYISAEHSPDALLTIQAYPMAVDQIGWGALVTWAQNREAVQDQPSLASALRQLWSEVDRNHVVFNSREALLKRPVNYAEHEWLDSETVAIVWRVTQVTHTVFALDWQLVFVYQPVESVNLRFQARLLAQQNTIRTGATGPSLCDACRELYRNAAPYYVAASGKQLDEI